LYFARSLRETRPSPSISTRAYEAWSITPSSLFESIVWQEVKKPRKRRNPVGRTRDKRGAAEVFISIQQSE
jgi:hypothetical protein